MDSPSVQNADAALECMVEERNRLDQHIADLTRTRDSLDPLIEINRAHRATLAS